MTKLQKVCWVLVTCLGMAASFVTFAPTAWQDYVASWIQVVPQSKIVKAIVVLESGDPNLLTKEQIAWLMSKKFRTDCKVAGIDFHPFVDPQEQDRDKKTPAELAPAIELATKRGLPRLILVGASGGLTDFVVPTDETAARKLILGG